MVTVGLVLSGCGYLDGTEIHEAVLAAYFLQAAGAELRWFAPDVDQMHVVDHRTGQEVPGERRNVLTESARIARGDIAPVDEARADDLDALVLPGGFGAAKNLSSFATEGAACQVHPAVEQLVRDVHAAGKPIGALCIAPAVIARVLGAGESPRLTIGTDADTAAALNTMGARHEARGVDEIAFDADRNIVSTPAYMLGPDITAVAAGIEQCCRKVVEQAAARVPTV